MASCDKCEFSTKTKSVTSATSATSVPAEVGALVRTEGNCTGKEDVQVSRLRLRGGQEERLEPKCRTYNTKSILDMCFHALSMLYSALLLPAWLRYCCPHGSACYEFVKIRWRSTADIEIPSYIPIQETRHMFWNKRFCEKIWTFRETWRMIWGFLLKELFRCDKIFTDKLVNVWAVNEHKI